MKALGELKCAPLFDGFRGRPRADLSGAADVILTIAALVEKDPASIVELDINPLMLLAEGRGVVAADALISMKLSDETEFDKRQTCSCRPRQES